jgi:hypothetical protein
MQVWWELPALLLLIDADAVGKLQEAAMLTRPGGEFSLETGIIGNSKPICRILAEFEVGWLQLFPNRLALLLKELRVADAINSSDELHDISHMLHLLSRLDKELAHNLVEAIDIESLAMKLENGTSAYKVSWCYSKIAETNQRIASKLISSVVRRLMQDGERTLIESAATVAKSDLLLARTLLDAVNFSRLVEIIDKEDSAGELSSLLEHLSRIDNEKLVNILERLNGTFQRAVRHDESLHSISGLLKQLAEIDVRLAVSAAESLEVEKISRIIRAEKLYLIHKPLSEIGRYNAGLIRALSNMLIDKIYAELPDPMLGFWHVADLLAHLRSANPELHTFLIQNLDVKRFAKSVGRVPGAKLSLPMGLQSLCDEIYRVSPEWAYKLFEQLSLVLGSDVLEKLRQSYIT